VYTLRPSISTRCLFDAFTYFMPREEML
jgi:hypothetical protein